tara:strand:- start:442598 stop:443461 length:864 start_codon:yes stop_codon:yes gene_type:complete
MRCADAALVSYLSFGQLLRFAVCISMNEDETLGRRKEPRFKTEDAERLQCDCFHEDEQPRRGSIIDMSTHGVRFLCNGGFRIGQVVLIELKTDRSFGAFGGIIRRVDPWVGGQTVYGCELIEPLTGDVLETLARERIVNRRNEDRVCWNQPAKMTWELHSGEIDIEIQDCSTGGLKVLSPTTIPDDVRLRIRVEADEDIVIEAKSVWQVKQDDQCHAGIAFINRHCPDAVAQIVEEGRDATTQNLVKKSRSSMRPSILVAATAVTVCGALLLSGWLPEHLLMLIFLR